MFKPYDRPVDWSNFIGANIASIIGLATFIHSVPNDNKGMILSLIFCYMGNLFSRKLPHPIFVEESHDERRKD